MAIHPLVCADAAVAASQNVQVLEFLLVGQTLAASNGVKLKLIPAQSVAQSRVVLNIGEGSCANAQASAAEVEALIKRPNGNSLSQTEENIKTGLQALLNEVEALADSAEAVVFAVGGLNACEFVAAELVVSSGAAEQTLTLRQTASAVRIPEPVKLVSGKLAKDAAGTVAVDLDTDKVVVVGGLNNGSACTIAGCITVVESDRVALTSANTVKLRLHVRN